MVDCEKETAEAGEPKEPTFPIRDNALYKDARSDGSLRRVRAAPAIKPATEREIKTPDRDVKQARDRSPEDCPSRGRV